LLDRAVIETPRILQLVLDIDQLGREIAEILIGLQSRIAFLQKNQFV